MSTEVAKYRFFLCRTTKRYQSDYVFYEKQCIDVQLDYSLDKSNNKLDFNFFMFDKGIMIDYSDESNPKVKPEYTAYTIDTFNRFFGVMALTKMEIFQVRYGENGNVVELVQRFSKSSFLDAFQPIGVFVKLWITSQFRRQYRRYVFEPELPITQYDFNLYLGMNIELEDFTGFEYDEERLIPFQQHVLKYFCRNKQESYDYFMNYFARKVQMPGNKNGVGMVLKTAKEGVGKGLVIDCLLGNNIFGELCYAQVGNMEALIGKFNSILMNKLLVNVDEVSMTKAQADTVKGMITGETMLFEKKGLDKITLKNHTDFVFTSNNDFCVCIGLHDRRYFILDTDDSNANDQEYYTSFRNYCIDPETAKHVYRYLMSIDISDFNPKEIPDTEEKQLYRENAIPLSIRF